MKAIMCTRNIHCKISEIHCQKINEIFDIENHSYEIKKMCNTSYESSDLCYLEPEARGRGGAV